MHTPTPDASTASIRLSPSHAISALLESQQSIFGSANGDDSRLLLTRLEPTQLDGLATYVEIENKIEQVARAAMEEAVGGIDFDLDWSMVECRKDVSMANLVKKLVGDGSDLSELEKYETTTVRVAMKLVLILVEKQALLALVSGLLRTFTRPNGRMAIWGKLPERLRKFYCIGMARKLNRTNRVEDYDIAESHDYIVSPKQNPNLFEMP